MAVDAPRLELPVQRGQSVISIIAWRAENMDDERWRELIATHEREILLIKSLLVAVAANNSRTAESTLGTFVGGRK